MKKTYLQKITEYISYMIEVKKGKVIEFPFGYCCSDRCGLAFSNYQARNYHEWKEHPGCVRYRKNTFWDWLFDGDTDNGKSSGIYHSCVCSKNDINTCSECKRTMGVYR